MRTSFVVLFLSLGAARAAHAQSGPGADIDLQAFRPAMDSRGFVTVDASGVLASGQLSFGLVTTWAGGVLSFDDDDGATYQVDHLVSPTLLAAVGVRPFGLPIELGVSLPFGVMAGDRGPDSDGGTPGNPNDDENFRFSGQGIGDLGVHAKLRLRTTTRLRRVGAAVIASATLPTATADASWIADDGASAGAKLVVDTERGRWRLAANLGVRFAGATTFRDDMSLGSDGMPRPITGGEVAGGSSLPFGVAAAWALSPEKFELLGEVYGAAPLDGDWFPLEAVAGVKVYLAKNSFLSLGAGAGLLPGANANADTRAFLGIVFEPGTGDRDGDGLRDDVDRCPSDPEDYDDFADGDGCPDLDDDQDGIVDALDDCRLVPEDKDGDDDRDGCPEGGTIDRDGDGIVDNLDECPDEPEDADGYQDDDGCPDPDNDRDQILDLDDLCPDEPEDVDEFEDVDGCPEPGPVYVDGDGTIVVLDSIYFKFDSAIIEERSHAILRAVAHTMTLNPDLARIEVQGHTDDRGDDAYNLELSQRRAEAVRTFLVGEKVDPGRLTARGYGETDPIVHERNEEAWAQNRRVEFVIIERRAP